MGEETNNSQQQTNQTFNINGDIKAGFVMQGGTATFNGGTFTYTEGETGNAELVAEIEKMIADLKEKAEAEADDPKEALKVEMVADSALEAAKEENPEAGIRKIRGEDLVKAAKNIASVTPIAVEIAKMLLLLK